METGEVLPASGIESNTLGYKQVLMSDAGTTLADMLHTESVLQSNDVATSTLTSSPTSTPLTQLLTSDSPFSDNNNMKIPHIPDSLMIEGEPFHNGITTSMSQMVSQHTLSTAGTLVQILQKGSSALAGRTSTQLTTQLPTQLPTRTRTDIHANLNSLLPKSEPVNALSVFNEITGQGLVDHTGQGLVDHTAHGLVDHTGLGLVDHTSQGLVDHTGLGLAAHTGLGLVNHTGLGVIDQSPDAVAIALAEDNGLFPNLEDQTLSLLNGEDSNTCFENGIAATDMDSLLEQFEAAGNFPMEDELSLLMDCANDTQVTYNNILDQVQGHESLQALPQRLSPVAEGQGHLPMHPDQGDVVQGQSLMDLVRGPGQSQACQGQSVSPDSEVVKLLKAPSVLANPRAQNSGTSLLNSVHTSPGATPSSEKIKSGSKRKAAAMLSDSTPPAKTSKPISSPTLNKDSKRSPPPKVIPLATKESAVRKLLQGSDSSGRNSPVDGASVEKRKVSIAQYRQRLKQRLAGMNDDSMDSLTSSGSGDAKQVGDGFQVNNDYFQQISDHDYCQNILSVQGTPSEETGVGQAVVGGEGGDCTLKGLLLNKNLSEELKEQAIKDRAVTRRNMSITAGSANKPGPMMAIEFNSKPRRDESFSRCKRNYRRRKSSPDMQPIQMRPQRPLTNNVMDKLPSYCTTLASQPIPGMTKKKKVPTATLR